MLTCAAIKSLITDSHVPLMQLGFLLFLPNSVTDHFAVYTIMNALKVVW